MRQTNRKQTTHKHDANQDPKDDLPTNSSETVDMQCEESNYGESGRVIVYGEEGLTVACFRSVYQEVTDIHRYDCMDRERYQRIVSSRYEES